MTVHFKAQHIGDRKNEQNTYERWIKMSQIFVIPF